MKEMLDKEVVLAALEKEREFLLANRMNGAEHILVHHAINVIRELPKVDALDKRS